MNKDILVANVIGGLCNRLWTIAAALRWARLTNRNLEIVWCNNNDLAANYFDLFEAAPIPLKIHNPSRIEYDLKWEIPRKRNLYLSGIYQKIRFAATYSDAFGLKPYLGKGDDFIKCIQQVKGDILVTSGSSVGGFDEDLFRELFIPSQVIQSLIKEKTKYFDTHTIGVHIRRTDNLKSIEQSPVDMFVQEMHKCIMLDDKANFFIASDDVSVQDKMKNIFGERVSCGDTSPTRRNLDGMMQATADLWALSMTSCILGSFSSSYTGTAALIGKIPLKVISKCGRAW